MVGLKTESGPTGPEARGADFWRSGEVRGQIRRQRKVGALRGALDGGSSRIVPEHLLG